MNGQYHLINRKGNKFKFYWAPMHPEINRTDYSKWGVVERLYINGFECFYHSFTTNHKFSMSLSIISAVSFSSSFSTSL